MRYGKANICDAAHLPKLRIYILAGCREIHMRKTILFTAAVVALVLTGIGTWVGVRILNPTGALARSADKPPVMMTGAKGLPTSPHDDYEIVVY
jgi:hypothetical protein